MNILRKKEFKHENNFYVKFDENIQQFFLRSFIGALRKNPTLQKICLRNFYFLLLAIENQKKR